MTYEDEVVALARDLYMHGAPLTQSFERAEEFLQGAHRWRNARAAALKTQKEREERRYGTPTQEAGES